MKLSVVVAETPATGAEECEWTRERSGEARFRSSLIGQIQLPVVALSLKLDQLTGFSALAGLTRPTLQGSNNATTPLGAGGILEATNGAELFVRIELQRAETPGLRKVRGN